MQKSSNKKIISRNRRALFDYDISKTFNAGLVLKGYEVKSVRAGQVSFGDSFIRVERGEVWLVNTYIALWRFAQVKDYEPRGRRKLLLTKKEIHELKNAQEARKMVIIPLEIFSEGRKLKLKIGIGKGRKKYDKRAKLKEREMRQEIKEDLASFRES